MQSSRVDSRRHARVSEPRPSKRPPAPDEPRNQSITVRIRDRVLLLRATDIDWIEAKGNYARLHVGKESYIIRETMTALERRLDSAHFMRIHRSTIVNRDRIRELRPWLSGDYIVVLENGAELKLSRGYRDKLDHQVGRFL